MMRPTLAPALALAALLLMTLACNFPTATSVGTATLTPLPQTFVLSVPTGLPTTSTVPSLVPSLSTSPTARPAPVPTMPFADAGSVLAGVCYGYLQTLSGQSFLFNSTSDLTAFYNQVDRSKRCTDAVSRQTFDFTAQEIVGTVLTGQGCGLDAMYDHIEDSSTDGKRTIIVSARLRGACPYDLVRPVWLTVPRSASIGAISVR